MFVAGCAPIVNIPPQKSDVATHDPNNAVPPNGARGEGLEGRVFDLRGTEVGLELKGACRAPRCPPVPRKPDVKISMPDPAYNKTDDGRPIGYGYFGHMCKLADGTLLANFWERARSHTHIGRVPTRMVTRRSNDDGRTWDDPVPIPGVACALALSDGTVWFSTQKRKGKWVIPRTTDQGRTIQFDLEVETNAGDPMIEMSNGEIVFLCTLSGNPPATIDDPKAPGPRGGWIRGTVITDKKLSKWQIHPAPELGSQVDEQWVTEYKPGRLVMLMRDQNVSRYFMQAHSDDYGRTWRDYKPSGVWHSAAVFPFVMTLDDGTVVGIAAQRRTGRIIAVPSFDGGHTWDLTRRVPVCDNRQEWFRHGDFGYPDAVQVTDGRILVRYYDAAVKDPHTQWGDWGNYFDPTHFRGPHDGVQLVAANAVADEHLIGQWSFEEEAGIGAADRVRGNYAKIIGTVNRRTGKLGRGVHFDGRTYAEVTDDPSVRVPNYFSIETWFRTDRVKGEQALIGKRPAYYVGLKDDKLVFEVGDPSGRIVDVLHRVESKVAIEPGRWYHVVAARGVYYDGYRYMWIYIDGKLDDLQPIDTSPVLLWYKDKPKLAPLSLAQAFALTDRKPEAGPMFWFAGRLDKPSHLWLGRDNLTADKPFFGDLDEVALFDRALLPKHVRVRARRRFDVGSAGTVTTPAIQRPEHTRWTQIVLDARTPKGTGVAVDLLDENGKLLQANVEPRKPLPEIGAGKIRLRAKLSTDDPALTPVLRRLGVRWEGDISDQL